MENEVRLIDANALQRRICKANCNREYEDCRDEGDCEFDFFIFWAPTIDPDSLRPKGRWVCIKDNCNENPVYKCSECGQEVASHDGTNIQKALNYCPNCGAKMMEGET